jgi:hypothetical protein
MKCSIVLSLRLLLGLSVKSRLLLPGKVRTIIQKAASDSKAVFIPVYGLFDNRFTESQLAVCPVVAKKGRFNIAKFCV